MKTDNIKTIYTLNEKINEQSIIDSAKFVENILISENISSAKIQNVFELIIEVMQNSLNYSVDTKSIGDNKKESEGKFFIHYDDKADMFILESSNIMDSSKQKRLTANFEEVVHLDKDSLRKLSRKRMREKSHVHDDGAGLGIITMVKKSQKPLDFDFVSIDNQTVKFVLRLFV